MAAPTPTPVTVLVAENDAPVRKLITQVLRRAGYNVLSASGGQEALTLAKRRSDPIQLVIADIVMPGVGGADLYAWLKAERPDVQVLFVSGFMSRAPLPGAFLQKPFSAEQLLAKVGEVLRGASGG